MQNLVPEDMVATPMAPTTNDEIEARILEIYLENGGKGKPSNDERLTIKGQLMPYRWVHETQVVRFWALEGGDPVWHNWPLLEDVWLAECADRGRRGLSPRSLDDLHDILIKREFSFFNSPEGTRVSVYLSIPNGTRLLFLDNA